MYPTNWKDSAQVSRYASEVSMRQNRKFVPAKWGNYPELVVLTPEHIEQLQREGIAIAEAQS